MSVITYFGGSRKLKKKNKNIYINEKNIPERLGNCHILVEKDQNI
jgi:hypothetical protein